MRIFVLDLETSGLNATPNAIQPNEFVEHRPGVDPDCILEIGLVVLNADTLEVEHAYAQGLYPPGVEDVEDFDRWTTQLREKNAFVYGMHAESGLFADIRRSFEPGFLGLRTLEESEKNLCKLVERFSERAKIKDAGPIHPGNSDVMLVGNSISNLDIPMLRLWMPEFHKMLSYRIMDVSVLRSFYQDLSKVALPEGLAERIKSGTGRSGGRLHRALDDAKHCAEALRECVAYARSFVR